MTSIADLVAQLVASSGVEQTASDAADEALLARMSNSGGTHDDVIALARSGAILETEGLVAYRATTAGGPEADDHRRRAESYFAQAGSCARLIAEMRRHGSDATSANDDVLPAGLDLPVRIAVAGLVSRRTADVRLELGPLVVRGEDVAASVPGYSTEDLDWEQRLQVDTFGAFVLLVRKSDGWDDVNAAVDALERLREAQAEQQPTFLARAAERGEQESSAARLVALFHLAQSVTLVGSYLRTGQGSSPALISRLDRHRDQALSGLAIAGRFGDDLRQISELLWVGCRELVRNSIWSHVDGLGARLTELAKHLADPGRERPVLELWPSQQEALAGNVLDQYRRAVLVQMPTSAGKTLLAEFLIVQSRALLPDSTAAYVVPTRALVNQVTRDLRSDLGPLGISIEQAVSAYELDPAEQIMLSERPEVLVATPEKLSLLIRRNDPSVSELGLVIVDEAHNLGDGARGARLELLLATIRRDKPGVRYLLLSPFLPNAQQLVDWLGEDRGLPPIAVRWKPGRRVVATAKVEGRRPNRQLLLETLDAAGGADLRAGHRINLRPVSNEDLTGSKSIKATTRLAVRELRRRGTTLILCWGRATAMTRTAELAAGEPTLPAHPLREAVASYLDAELGDDSALARFIRSGFAYHHSGMSHEARSLIECLVRNDLVHTVCGTTTLAQGVNFPITNVLIETSRKGQDASLSYADLWNVIGRAGRALVDDAGLVVFPVADDAQADKWQEYMRGEAREIASQLSKLIDQADQLGAIGLREVRATPELGDMLQFLAHAMHVGGAQQTSAELEDLLRSSLVYRQASTAPGRSDKLIGLCRRYLEQISTQPGQAALSDQTGFSTPTIGMILGHRSDYDGFSDPDAWQPSALFGAEQTPLTERMRVLGEVPELGLGWEAAGTFNPERVAKIVSGWVNGRTLMQLAGEFGDADSTDAEARDKEVAKFASYLYSTVSYKASWGLGALESAYLSTPEEPDPTDGSRYVPSMVYFGVKTPQAVWMRMAGLPRVAAEQLGALWQARVGAPPRSHSQLRSWVGGLSETDWDQAVDGDRLAGAQMKRLWDDALA